MYTALIFKEWLKTRYVFYITLVLSLLMSLYVILTTNSFIASKGEVALWLAMILKDASTVNPLKYMPLIVGIALGIAQFVPEMSHKRLKLTLHLPCSHHRLLITMLAVGTSELLFTFLLQTAAILCYDITMLPSALIGRILLTLLPWYVAGLCAYMAVSAICLEGTKMRRVVLGLLSVAIVFPLLNGTDAMAAYNYMIIPMIIIFITLATLSFGSIARFKEGLQD